MILTLTKYYGLDPTSDGESNLFVIWAIGRRHHCLSGKKWFCAVCPELIATCFSQNYALSPFLTFLGHPLMSKKGVTNV